MKENQKEVGPKINKEKVVRVWGKIVESVKGLADITIYRFIAATKLFVEIEGEVVKDVKYLITTYPKVVKDILEFSIEKANEVLSFSVKRVTSDDGLMEDIERLTQKYKDLISEYDSQILRVVETMETPEE